MSKELTKQDRCDWNLQKAICKRHLIPLMETAKALKAIRSRKLWRVEHESFEAFIENLYGRSLSWANNLIVKQIGPTTYAGAENTSETSENPTGATENADSTPGATENEGSGESEAAPSKPKSSPPDLFKKLDDLIGKAIRKVDEIGAGEHHDRALDLLRNLMHEITRWRAA